jgi:hypothetical protein
MALALPEAVERNHHGLAIERNEPPRTSPFTTNKGL